MTSGVRTPNLPAATLIEVLGHYDAGGGRRAIGRASLAALIDALRGVISTDPTGVATLRADLNATIAVIDVMKAYVDTVQDQINERALLASVGDLQDQINRRLTLEDGSDLQDQINRRLTLEDGGRLQDQINERATLGNFNALSAAVGRVQDSLSDKASQSHLGSIEDAISLLASSSALASLSSLVEARRAEFLQSDTRPGDGPLSFTIVPSLLGLANPATAPALPAGAVSFGPNGFVAILTGTGVIASRRMVAIEPGRIYRARFAFRRVANPSDPSNDSVQTLIVWFDQSRTMLPSPTLVQDLQDLKVSDGRQSHEVLYARSDAGGSAIVAPTAARYACLAIRSYGPDGRSEVEVLNIEDATGAALLDPISADFAARLGAVESADAGPRLDEVESQLQGPNSLTLPTLSDAASRTIASGVTTLDLRGRDAPGDGAGGLYARIAGGLPDGVDGFTSLDGAVWARVLTAQAVFNATFKALLPGFLAGLPEIPADESQIPSSGGVYRSGPGSFIVIPPSA